MRDRDAVINVLFEQAQDWQSLGDATRFMQVLLGLIASDELPRAAAQNISWAAMRHAAGEVDADGLRRVIEVNTPV